MCDICVCCIYVHRARHTHTHTYIHKSRINYILIHWLKHWIEKVNERTAISLIRSFDLQYVVGCCCRCFFSMQFNYVQCNAICCPCLTQLHKYNECLVARCSSVSVRMRMCACVYFRLMLLPHDIYHRCAIFLNLFLVRAWVCSQIHQCLCVRAFTSAKLENLIN